MQMNWFFCFFMLIHVAVILLPSHISFIEIAEDLQSTHWYNKTYSKTDSPHTLKLLELNSICICSRNIFPLYLTYQGTICIVY